MSDDRKDLPPVSAPNFNERLREAVSTYLGNRGNKLDRGVTLRDLSEAGLVTLRKGFLAGTGSGASPISGVGTAITDAYEPDLAPPPTPTGFTASAAISNVFIECDAPLYPQGHGHAKTVVYGATWVSGPLPTFTEAVRLTEFSGTVFAHPTNPATTWHLWIKWVTADGVASASPAGGTNGVVVTTGLDVSRLVAAMTGPGNPFKIVSAPITLADGTIVPVGTYTSDAYMASFVAARGQIGLLAVDDARIASLKVSKLEGDSLKVGSFISSSNYIAGSQGFRINADGLAEFSNVVVRGTVYAVAGTFSGTISASVINGGTINSATLNSATVNSAIMNSTTLNSGAVNIQGDGGSGWGVVRSYNKWWGDGASGWVMARNAADGSTLLEFKTGSSRIWSSSWDDCGIQFPGISMTNGGLTISQVNAINTINIAGSAITEHYLAASGATSSNNDLLCNLGFTVPAGQTWQVTAQVSCAATASGGNPGSDAGSATYGSASAGVWLRYNGGNVDGTGVNAAGFGVTAGGSGLAQHTATFTSGQGITVSVVSNITASNGAGTVSGARLIVFISKK